jgi:hypothetical protein
MALDGITLHEGYNNFGTFEIDITSVEVESSIGDGIKSVTPPVSENLLFKINFDPSGSPVPPDYTVKLDLTPLNDTTAITSELIARGGQQTFSFTLSSTPIEAGSVSITDGLELFYDRGDGTLRGSEGGSGTIDYSTGAGSVTFFTPPVFGDNVIANYKKHVSVISEDLGAATTATTYDFTLAHNDVVPGTLTITIGTVTLVDGGSGTLTGTGGSGTIDYSTGDVTISLTTTVTGHFLADYTYWGAATPETIGTGALTTDFNFKLVHHPIIVGSLSVTDGTETFSDNSDGTLTGSLGGAGTIDYNTGAGTLSFTTAPAWGTEITADYNTGNVMLETHTNNEGFIQINAPVYPVVTVKSTGDTFIDFDVVGTLDDRQDELYLELDGGGTGPIYTLITDMFVKSGYLQVFDGDSTYYKLYPHIAIGGSIAAVKINEKGQVSGYDSTTHQWGYIDTLTFHSIQHPEFLDIVSDGFYSTNTSTGTDTSGNLGDTSTVFENFKGVVNNPEPYYISVGVSVFEPGAVIPVKMQDFPNLIPGDADYHIVEISSDPYAAPDQTPTLDDIESITGTTFSTTFRTFLSSKGINTLDSARKAGPITYIDGYPSSLSPDEVALLQSHVDLYSINQDATQNQILVAADYGDVFKIANTTKNVFLNDVVGTGMPLYLAAQIQETAVQNQNLVSNLLAGALTDLRLANPATPAVSGSTFVSSALSHTLNSCGCNDCQSGVSPFAYLMDLLKYGAAHVNHLTAPLYSAGGTVSSFISLVSDQFLQPFGTLNVDCATLHDEFCRVRLVTEVFEKLVTNNITAGLIPPSAAQVTALATERKQFLTLVYKTLLLQAGTSVEELRDVYVTPLATKAEAAQKLTSKLGIPLYMPSSPTTLTTDRMWLTLTGTGTATLNAANLEAVFGFRDTQRNVLTSTPVSFMESWRAAYLRDKWEAEDYLLNDYSREGVIPTNNTTFKSNWRPIIDPDIIGWTDFTYLNDSTNYPASAFSKSLWQNRKADTDAFLTWCISDNSTTSRTSADMSNRIFKVTDRNIVSHNVENDTVQIEYPSGTWNDYTMIARALVDTDTNVILKKSTPGDTQPAMLQPYGSTPKMRYNRIVTVTSAGSPGTSITLTFSSPVIFDGLTGGYAKLESSATGTTPYETNPPGASPYLISAVSFNPNHTQATLTFPNPDFPDVTFLGGTLTFTYEVEVPIFTDVILDPDAFVDELFTVNNFNYTLLASTPPGMTSPYPYTIWTTPSMWPSGVTAMSSYGKLKQMQQLLAANTSVDEITTVITDNLNMSIPEFNRMMQLLISCEDYLISMYVAPRPSAADLYEIASIVRNSAKPALRDTWVKEEIKHLDGSSNPIALKLSSQFFWKSLTEPASGPWDPSLQTIPASIGDITADHIAIIDPELLPFQNMAVNPDAKPYRDLFNTRQGTLDSKFATYKGLVIPFSASGFISIFNEIASGSTGTSFTSYITPYTTLDGIQTDVQSNDVFAQEQARNVLWSVFRLSPEDFLSAKKIKDKYELNDPLQYPSTAEIVQVIKILVSAFKRRRLYPGTTGWIAKEIDGSYTSPNLPVLYYNVLKMNLAPGRSNASDRSDWQSTLKSWNRLATIHPDIVPPENILNFGTGNWVYTKWNSRHSSLLSAYTTLVTYIYDTGDASVLLDNLQKQIDLVIGRVTTFSPLTPQVFYPYFEAIKDIEESGEDIQPNVTQLGFTIAEYRYLAEIIRVLGLAGGGAVPLIDTEYDDVINILIAARSRTTPFTQVLEEYDQGIILDQDYFQIYNPSPVNFPLTDLPVYNQWRSPQSLRKAWLEILQTRIDEETRIKDKWKAILMEAEDRNMPLMRDALIRALTQNCENWKDAAERLAKSYFVETKDNCCVKHTRVSFAMETLQGFLWALETGVYDDFISNYSLTSPQFKEEWKWIGSYASWRSAMFVFLYPENLLYPTLKRFQTPAFRDLSLKLQDASTFTPEQACQAGQDFEHYLRDIQTMRLICSTTTQELFKIDSDVCCGDGSSVMDVTYYFGQSRSGATYYCVKPYNDNSSGALGFWYKLNLPAYADVLGCFVSRADDDPNTNQIFRTLILFYTYQDKGKMKIAFIKKDVSQNPDSDWSEENDTGDLPLLPSGDAPVKISACQDYDESQPPFFNFSYYVGGQYENIIRRFLVSEQQFDTSNNNNYTNDTDTPISGIRHFLYYGTSYVIVVTRVYSGSIKTEIIDSNIGQSVSYFNGIIGAFQCQSEQNTLIVITKVNGIVTVNKVVLNFTGSFGNPTVTQLTKDSIINKLNVVYPVFSYTDLFNPYFAINDSTMDVNLGTCIGFPISGTGCVAANPFDLTPKLTDIIPVQSADCISDMDTRTNLIRTNLKYNYNLYQGTSLVNVTRTTAVHELLFEAYYYVPMLLALDQQRRGQFDAALSWYRSVYDYTNPLVAKRKIFYGLVLEESINTTFLQANNWLLDPLNPHQIAQTRANAYSRYTITNIIQCIYSYADQQFTLDTSETVPTARRLYTTALDLLKTNEIQVGANQCMVAAINCTQTQINMTAARTWSGMFTQLQDAMNGIGDATLIESISDDIADLLNGATEDTYAESFAEAFDLVQATIPDPSTPNTVTEVIEGSASRMNDAYRYLSALNNFSDFNIGVGENYLGALASVSGLTVDEVTSGSFNSRMAWLYDAPPSNNVDYVFAFASGSGQQNLSPGLTFNPLSPTGAAYNANLTYSNASRAIGNQQGVFIPGYIPLMYYPFCTAPNPIYNALQLKGNVELYKIFNCRNIAGMIRELDVYPAPTDTVSGLPFIGASGNLTLPAINNYSPSQYRFDALIQRAQAVAQQAQQMESLFLSALEKEDAENYAQLRASQDLETAKATIKMQDLRISQAQDESVIASLQLDKATFTQDHYQNLIASGLNSFEQDSLAYLKAAEVLDYIAAAFNTAASIKVLYSDALGKVSTSLSYAAAAVGNSSSAISTQASWFSQMASYQRRTEDWYFQKDLAGFDVSIANQQIKVADDNIRIVTQEREIAVLNASHAQDSLQFLKNKFTNAELYNFMAGVLERSYSYMLNLATAIARTAESQLYFERQEQAGSFILDDYWETPSSGFTGGSSNNSPDRRGLTGSARLIVDITRLQQFAIDSKKRKLQMTKVISLAQNFPSEFQTFKETGIFNFSLTNKMFDYDFPGHYLRLINDVKTTVIGLIPVYDSIKATLTADTISYTVIGGTSFQKIPIRRMELESVALTSANSATGLFEMQPAQPDLLNPFESMGVESRWEFRMPQFSNHFDFDNIADIVLSVDYTALDSYEYRTEVLQDLDNTITFNRGFSFKNNFPDQWYELAQAEAGPQNFGVNINLTREMFPQGILNLALNQAEDIVLYFVRDDSYTLEISVLDFSKVPVNNNQPVYMGSDTVNGTLPNNLMGTLGNSPLVNLQLLFENNPINRDLFSSEKVKDILLIIPCRGELKSYPL